MLDILHMEVRFPISQFWPGADVADHWMMHCGMEVILPSGGLMRTGMGALPQNPKKGSKHDHNDEGNKCWQLFPYGFGPYNDGLFSQGNVGICTKMGLWVCVSQI